MQTNEIITVVFFSSTKVSRYRVALTFVIENCLFLGFFAFDPVGFVRFVQRIPPYFKIAVVKSVARIFPRKQVLSDAQNLISSEIYTFHANKSLIGLFS